MSQKILSICIATFNRAAFIGETLDSIIGQISSDDLEIVIVDGASTDNTENIVREYQKKCAQIRYVRLAQKGGVDHDYDQAVLEASGKFCWLFSDDDLFKEDAVDTILRAIERGNELIIVNAETRNATLAEVIHPQQLRINKDGSYALTESDQERLFRDAALYLSFIGAVVIRRDIWMERERTKYFGTEFIHVGVIFQSPINACVIARPLIIIRAGNASWSTRKFEIWNFKWPGLIWAFDQFTDEAKRSITPREPWRMLKSYLIERASGIYDLNQYHKLYASRLSSAGERLMAQVTAIFPGALLNPAALLYFRLFIPQDKLLPMQLKNSRFYWRNLLKYLM